MQKESLFMINLAVINLKTLLKKIIKIMAIFLSLAMMIKFVQIVYQASQKFDIESFGLKNNLSMIQNNLNFSYSFEKNPENKTSELKKILVAELAVFSGAEEEIMEQENQEEVLDFENMDNTVTPENTPAPKEENKSTEQSQTQQPENVQTSIIEANNKKDVYTDTYKSVQIKNESQYSLTQEMLTPDLKFNDTQNIILYHTHTCESYTPTKNSQYTATGNYRTTDLNYSVARVGTELANQLTSKGYTAIHDANYHDYPAYTGSYTRSLATVKNLLASHSSVDCVFDVHRDALRKQQQLCALCENWGRNGCSNHVCHGNRWWRFGTFQLESKSKISHSHSGKSE